LYLESCNCFCCIRCCDHHRSCLLCSFRLCIFILFIFIVFTSFIHTVACTCVYLFFSRFYSQGDTFVTMYVAYCKNKPFSNSLLIEHGGNFFSVSNARIFLDFEVIFACYIHITWRTVYKQKHTRLMNYLFSNISFRVSQGFASFVWPWLINIGVFN